MNYKLNRYVPDFYFDNIFKIPYDLFLSQGFKGIFFDLDNTLMCYSDKNLSNFTKKFLQKINEKFKIVIVSNASKKKLQKICNNDFLYVYLNIFCKKPSLFGFKHALKLINLPFNQVLMVGDQLITDIWGAHKMKIKSILVKPINREKEFLFTKFKRFWFERVILKKIKKQKNEIYENKLKNFANYLKF
ncbi:Had superfamily phosphatase, subfamily IIIa [Candidatus Phytoplasma mali]|uniref:Had superfamily phosphatase, subfamily IIIa n=1 Tax=Phytoplasma mali (strain AT) TaxID=482235 RepID=B3QZP5_PHYMT|nr:HAD-IIIA family hydrolase [Candidatus Phytoplasma mali]CAP18432.1 Had superfamily phosphatase, subfamily IIIa [Candidatus Phytoplasma mali]